MREPEKFNRVLVGTLTIYVMFLCLFSSIAYWSYGHTLEDVVTLNLPHDNLTSTVQVFYCFGLLGSYPMQLIPVFEIIESSNLYKSLPTLSSYLPTKRLFLRTLMVLLTAIGATVVPKFGLFINLVGSFACTALAFILPVIMYNKTHKDKISRKWRLVHIFLVVFGCVCGTISFVMSVKEIIAAFSSKSPTSEEIANPVQNGEVTEIDLNTGVMSVYHQKTPGMKLI